MPTTSPQALLLSMHYLPEAFLTYNNVGGAWMGFITCKGMCLCLFGKINTIFANYSGLVFPKKGIRIIHNDVLSQEISYRKEMLVTKFKSKCLCLFGKKNTIFANYDHV